VDVPVLESLARANTLGRVKISAEAQFKAEFENKKPKFNIEGSTTVAYDQKKIYDLELLTEETVN